MTLVLDPSAIVSSVVVGHNKCDYLERWAGKHLQSGWQVTLASDRLISFCTISAESSPCHSHPTSTLLRKLQ
jgi:hypothetical protein